MTKSNYNKKVQTKMWKTISTIAILLSATAFVSSSASINSSSISVLAAPSNGTSSSGSQVMTLAHTLVQNLSRTNLAVTLPLTRGYVNGFEVFYLSTEASDKALADHLTNFTHSRVSYTPALKNTPTQSLGNIYVF